MGTSPAVHEKAEANNSAGDSPVRPRLDFTADITDDCHAQQNQSYKRAQVLNRSVEQMVYQAVHFFFQGVYVLSRRRRVYTRETFGSSRNLLDATTSMIHPHRWARRASVGNAESCRWRLML